MVLAEVEAGTDFLVFKNQKVVCIWDRNDYDF